MSFSDRDSLQDAHMISRSEDIRYHFGHGGGWSLHYLMLGCLQVTLGG